MTITAVSRLENTGRRSKRLRSFVRREGRMTSAQKKALIELWDAYGIDNDNAILEWSSLFGDQVPVTVEIGDNAELKVSKTGEDVDDTKKFYKSRKETCYY